MTPLRALLIFLFLSISVAFGADVMTNEDGLVFFDETEGPEEVSVPIYTPNEEDEIPGPPGSGFFQTRKRAQSFHISAEELENDSSEEDDNALYPEYSAFGRKERIDSGTTVVDDWEGFDFENGTETPEYDRSKSNSTETQADPLTNLRQVFATLSKSRSRSFNKGNRMRLNLVALSEEEGEGEEGLFCPKNYEQIEDELI